MFEEQNTILELIKSRNEALIRANKAERLLADTQDSLREHMLLVKQALAERDAALKRVQELTILTEEFGGYAKEFRESEPNNNKDN
jgi:hypothetical protein